MEVPVWLGLTLPGSSIAFIAAGLCVTGAQAQTFALAPQDLNPARFYWSLCLFPHPCFLLGHLGVRAQVSYGSD